jgi:hypothetical protein
MGPLKIIINFTQPHVVAVKICKMFESDFQNLLVLLLVTDVYQLFTV